MKLLHYFNHENIISILAIQNLLQKDKKALGNQSPRDINNLTPN